MIVSVVNFDLGVFLLIIVYIDFDIKCLTFTSFAFRVGCNVYYYSDVGLTRSAWFVC